MSAFEKEGLGGVSCRVADCRLPMGVGGVSVSVRVSVSISVSIKLSISMSECECESECNKLFNWCEEHE